MSYDKEHNNVTAPPTPQQDSQQNIGGGHPSAPQVLPPTAGGGNRPTPATASVTGDTPVFQAYKHN